MVSSTLKIKQAASTAAWMALTFTRLGSQTKASMLSRHPSLSKSTPAQMFPLRCSTRRLLRISVASKPALSQSCRGMISRAFAKDLMMACCLCGTFLSAYRCRKPDTSICSPRSGGVNTTAIHHLPRRHLRRRQCCYFELRALQSLWHHANSAQPLQ